MLCFFRQPHRGYTCILKNWIPTWVYPCENGDRNDCRRNFYYCVYVKSKKHAGLKPALTFFSFFLPLCKGGLKGDLFPFLCFLFSVDHIESTLQKILGFVFLSPISDFYFPLLCFSGNHSGLPLQNQTPSFSSEPRFDVVLYFLSFHLPPALTLSENRF